MRRGKKHDAPDLFRHPVHGGKGTAGRGGPHEEHCIDAIQAAIKGCGNGEVSAHALNFGRQTGGVRIASGSAHSDLRRQLVRNNVAANISGGSGDEDAFHA